MLLIQLIIKSRVLYHFFKRIAYKKGRAAAITATAIKLAVIIWNMIVKKQPYNPPANEQYLKNMKEKRIKIIQKIMKRSNIVTSELSIV